MQYQGDMTQRLIDQMSDLVRRATGRRGAFVELTPHELADQAIRISLGMDTDSVAHLSPQVLASAAEMANTDERVIELLATALDLESEVCLVHGRVMEAELHRDQAAAVRRLLDPSRAN